MAPLPQLNLILSGSKNKISNGENEESELIVRTDSAFKTHTITIYITDEEFGKAEINMSNAGQKLKNLQLPTYKMLVTDTLTDEKETYEVARDFLVPSVEKDKHENAKSFWSFLTFKFLKPKTSSYDVMTFEPELQEEESYSLFKHRTLNHEVLHYSFKNGDNNVSLFAGDFDAYKQQMETLFLVIDGQKGQRFIGDILYREKFLKLTPSVVLKIIRRKKVPKSMIFNESGSINKIIYI